LVPEQNLWVKTVPEQASALWVRVACRLRTLDGAVAKVLVTFRGQEMHFADLVAIDLDSVKALAEYKGR
jgi:hypothetical protein